MKFIRKRGPPQQFSKFVRDNAKTPNAGSYDALDGKVKQSLAKHMLREQGRLCAYTMRGIGRQDVLDFHIKHIRAQSRHPELQLDYANLVLCAPGEDRRQCEWGAKHKDYAAIDDTFVSPLRADCESRLIFRADGTVQGADDGADNTIKLLNLNHDELVEERASALRASGLGADARRPLSASEAKRLGETICGTDAGGDYAPYCVAIQQVARERARKAARRSARLRPKP